jgi:protease-4
LPGVEHDMSDERPGLVRRILGRLWRAVDATRRFVFNLVFLLIVVAILVAWLGGGSRPKVADNTALVLDLKGDIVEQYTGSAREAELTQALGGNARETQLRDVVAVLDAAAKDAKIARAVLLLDDMGAARLAKLREIADAMERFKSTGKQVVAWASTMEQRQYYLAAHANEIYLHPAGMVLLTGFGGYRNYYRDALDHLGVTVNVFRVGKFKSAVEPFVNNAPSKEALEADASWLNDSWGTFTTDVEQARHLQAGSIGRLIDDLPVRLKAAGGDAALLAVSEHLVDALKTRDQLRALMVERGARDVEHKTFRQIAMSDYRTIVPETGDRRSQVGVIVAEGEIIDGEAPQGVIGARSTADLVRKAREDDSVKALVLRVDSPGGSAFGAELIRRELELTRQAGKPVVVSMSDLAASGGYWISTAADQVFADPGTITGSIGVFGMLPTFDRTMDHLSVHTGGVTTTWLAGAYDPRRPLDPRFGDLVQASVGHIYKEFLDHVAEARHSNPDQINEIAQGRVWTGRQAHERNLVDAFGGLTAAIAAAAEKAKLGDGFRVTYIELEPRGWGRLLEALPGGFARALAERFGADLTGGLAGPFLTATDPVRRDFARLLAAAGRPDAVLAHCLCGAP